MSRNCFGMMVRTVREEKGLTLIELCEGLCSVTTLSRIENGERVPDVLLAKTILERLGISTECFELVADDVEFEALKKREKIDKLLEKCFVKNAGRLLIEYERKYVGRNVLQLQYVLHRRVLILWRMSGLEDIVLKTDVLELPDFSQYIETFRSIYKDISSILNLTVKDPGQRIDAGCCLSSEEIKLILYKSYLECVILRHEGADTFGPVSVIEKIYNYIDSLYYNPSELTDSFAKAAAVLAKHYCMEGQMRKALRLVDDCLEKLYLDGNYYGKAYLYSVKGRLLEKMHECGEDSLLITADSFASPDLLYEAAKACATFFNCAVGEVSHDCI